MRSGTLLAIAGLLVGAPACSTVRSGATGGGPSELDRAALARCLTENARADVTSDTIRALAGRYRLHLFHEAGAGAASGLLDLWVPEPPAEPDDEWPEAASPLLIGAAEIDLRRVGAVPGGDVASRDPAGPGVGAYALPSGGAVLRLGAESNRRDRQRFDGAHTTLRILSIREARFGGRWRSDLGAAAAGGQFCAVRRG